MGLIWLLDIHIIFNYKKGDKFLHFQHFLLKDRKDFFLHSLCLLDLSNKFLAK